jgi:hypothetical protein
VGVRGGTALAGLGQPAMKASSEARSPDKSRDEQEPVPRKLGEERSLKPRMVRDCQRHYKRWEET